MYSNIYSWSFMKRNKHLRQSLVTNHEYIRHENFTTGENLSILKRMKFKFLNCGFTNFNCYTFFTKKNRFSQKSTNKWKSYHIVLCIHFLHRQQWGGVQVCLYLKSWLLKRLSTTNFYYTITLDINQ